MKELCTKIMKTKNKNKVIRTVLLIRRNQIKNYHKNLTANKSFENILRISQ